MWGQHIIDRALGMVGSTEGGGGGGQMGLRFYLQTNKSTQILGAELGNAVENPQVFTNTRSLTQQQKLLFYKTPQTKPKVWIQN